MFVARTGLKTRGSTIGGVNQSGLTALLAPKRRRKEDELGFYCWVPFMWKPCVAGFVGLFVLLGGTAMSVLGYYARDLATERVSNGTHAYHTVNDNKRISIGLLTYIGPVVMGFGCFTIVVACVVVCEQRDKEIRVKIEERKKKKLEKKEKKHDFYDAIVERLKKSKVYNARMLKENDKQAHLDTTKDTQNSEVEKLVQKDKSIGRNHLDMAFSCFSGDRGRNYLEENKYEHISRALMSIPMDIFTIQHDSRSGVSSLLPVRADPTRHIEQYKLREHGALPLRKCPSASCIADLVKVTEARLDQVFPDRKLWLKRSNTDLDPQDDSARDSYSESEDCDHSECVSSDRARGSPILCQAALLDETSSRTTPNDIRSTCSNPHSANSSYSHRSRACSKDASPLHSDNHSNDSSPASDASHSSAHSLSVIPVAAPADGSAQDAPPVAHKPNVILHYASVHSDAHGGHPTPLPHVETHPCVATGDEDPEVLALTTSGARSNALQMDTFRKHQACLRARAQSPNPETQADSSASQRRVSAAPTRSDSSSPHQDSSVLVLDRGHEFGKGSSERVISESDV